MRIKELIEKSIEIDELIKTSIVSSDEETGPILDGIIDPEKFLSAKYKILWILKEPYDSFDSSNIPHGGNWDLRKVLREKTSFIDFGAKGTYKPMISVSSCILNHCETDIDYNNLEIGTSMLNDFKSVALINLSKLPGLKRSNYNSLQRAYNLHKLLLLKQIESINPDIIIFGSTIRYFLPDLNFKKSELHNYESNKHILKDNRIYIDAYHPSQFTITKNQYCNDIVTVVNNLLSENKK
jgi:hypothetical protein